MFPKRSRASGVVMTMIAGGLGVCVPAYAFAQLQEKDALTPVIANLPLSTRVVVVSSKPSAVLDAVKGPWKRLGPMAAGLGSDTLKNWALLSRQLGYAPGEAFDALTSGGLAVVVAEPKGTLGVQGKNVQAAVDARWAVLTVVKGDVAARVRQRLKAAPHEVIGGLPVLSVEDGRFALVCRSLTDAEGGDEVLALTPTEDRAFLESVVASVEAARPRGAGAPAALAVEETLASTKAFATGKQTAADVLVLAGESRAVDAPADAKAWEHASVVACDLNQRAWTFDIREVSSGERLQPPLGRVPREAAGWYDAWSPNASVMLVVGGSPELKAAVDGVSPGLLAEKESFEGAVLYVGSPQGAEAAAKEVGGRVSAWAGMRVKGSDRSHTATMDGIGARLVRLIESGDVMQEFAEGVGAHFGEHGKAKPSPVDVSPYAAAGPMSLRVASVKVPAAASFAPLGQEPGAAAASVAWFQCLAGGSVVDSDPRWMVWGVEPTQEPEAVSARHRALAALLSNPQGKVASTTEQAWMWRAVVRPPRLMEALPTPVSFAIGFSGIGAVKEVRFEGWEETAAGSGGSSRARVVVDWAGPAAPATGGRP
jgi:hypothetical protein